LAERAVEGEKPEVVAVGGAGERVAWRRLPRAAAREPFLRLDEVKGGGRGCPLRNNGSDKRGARGRGDRKHHAEFGGHGDAEAGGGLGLGGV
jgi:hypothetical protein